MTVMASEQTKFKFKGYRVIKSKIDIAPSGNIKQELNVTFSGIKNDICDSVYILDLGVSVSNEDKSLGIDVEMRGFFEFDKELLEQEKGAFFTGSAPAIMFPYLRAYISTLTGLSGIEPIILPTINFSAGLQRAKKE